MLAARAPRDPWLGRTSPSPGSRCGASHVVGDAARFIPGKPSGSQSRAVKTLALFNATLILDSRPCGKTLMRSKRSFEAFGRNRQTRDEALRPSAAPNLAPQNAAARTCRRSDALHSSFRATISHSCGKCQRQSGRGLRRCSRARVRRRPRGFEEITGQVAPSMPELPSAAYPWSGTLEEYVAQFVVPWWPRPEQVAAWTEAALTWHARPTSLLCIRSSVDKGWLHQVSGRRVVHTDNSPGIWILLRARDEGFSASKWDELVEGGGIPVLKMRSRGRIDRPWTHARTALTAADASRLLKY